MPLPTFDPVTINNLIQPGSSSLEQRTTASRRGLPGQLATSGSPFPGRLRVPSTSSHALLDLQPPVGTVQDVSPETVRSQTSWHEGGDESNDGGLANPVRLLAEAAEEASSGSGGYGEQMGAIRPSSHRPPVLPPQYMLPDTMASLLHEGSVDPRIAGLSLDLDFLAQGLQALVAPTARQSLSAEDKAFFKPPKKMVKRDLGADCDPIDLALITETEANAFFDIYFQRLHPLLSVLDPELHKPAFVRCRSSFLFTAICAHGASLMSGAEQATKRLRYHAQKLSDEISRRGFASVEVVQAFLVWVSWLPSSEPFQEERLWHETKFAINMAVELGLSEPSPSNFDVVSPHASFLACFESIDLQNANQVGRIIRNRERLWIHLFLWDSSLSLAFGKATRFLQNEMIRNESWCNHPLASPEDYVTTASVVLRRRLVSVAANMRSEIHSRLDEPSDWICPKIDEVFQQWHATWTPQTNKSPYLELVYRYTRLWTLCYALQLLSARTSSVTALQDACFEAALTSCDFVCQWLKASRQLWGMPNTIGPMLSFKAILALRLFPQTHSGTGPAIASKARLLGLLSQFAHLLEQVGSTPPHRLGTAAVYGRQLQVYIRNQVLALCALHYQANTARGVRTGTSGEVDWAVFTEQSLSLPITGDTSESLPFLDAAATFTEDFFRIFE
ncbi:hypothetical protein JCM24511_00776 [Saitozyma sp. JCM 24511]|nr:hypothetical protein JCM24511_00776 [Saitozyma sp. JCM 24511]